MSQGQDASARTKTALLALGLVCALALGELSVRVLGIAPDQNVVYRDNYRLSDDLELQYELVPGSKDGETRISSAGLRDREHAQHKPAGVFRIAVIGDSIAYGFGIPQRDAFPAQLDELLRTRRTQDGKRFEVLNFAVTGYNIGQVVETLRARALAYEPDLIVYAYCLNDPQAESFELDALKAALSPSQRSYRDDLLRHGTHLLDRSRLWLTWRYLSRAHAPAGSPRDPQWVALASGSYAEYFSRLYAEPANAERLAHGLAELRRITSAARVPVLAAIFPIFVDLNAYRLRGLHQSVAQQFEQLGMRSHDLLPLYASMWRSHGSTFILNALHPDAVGQRLAALYLRRALECSGFASEAAGAQQPSELAQLDALLEPVLLSAAPPCAK